MSKVKALEWSDVREPNEEIRYDHCVAESILGPISIEWKSWKEHDSYTVFIQNDVLNEDTLEAAKASAQAYFDARIRLALSEEKAG